MYVLFWFLSMVVALIATATIAMALPRSAADELSASTPQSIFNGELSRIDTMFASCTSGAD